jgi:long-chain acyl-CoA synthetase
MTHDSIDPRGSLAHLVAGRASERPDFGLLYVEDDGPWTIRSVAAAANSLATQLDTAGIGRGSRVLVRLGNDERFLAALTAVWLRGAAAIAMHPAAPATEAARVVDSMGATAVVATPDDDAARTLPIPLLELDRLPIDSSFNELLDVPVVADDDEAIVLLTSGSTGAPKGVVLTHGNGWSNVRATVSAFRRDTTVAPIPDAPKPPNLVANPVSHTAGVVRLLFALYVGRAVVLLRKFDAIAAKRAIDRHAIDNLTINPAMLRMLLEELPGNADLGAVRYVSSGTAPLPVALREAFETRFGVPVLQAYGQTEAFGGVAIESVRDVLDGHRRPHSVGRALPGVEIRIADDGRDAPTGHEGEILVRTRSATAAYVGEGSPTSPVDEQGWLHTGDIGRLDDDGYLYVTGRLKNIIICGGFNVVPEEIEAALIADDDVRDAAVLGVADDRLGEVPVAVVESTASPDVILERVTPRLAPYKRPRHVVVLPALPRVPNGKVDRPATREIITRLLPSTPGSTGS